MAVMDRDLFSNVSWHSGQGGEGASSSIPHPADDDLESSSRRNGGDAHGLGDVEDFGEHMVGSEKLECTVSQPIKENDGTKDAYVSYLITTKVCQRLPFLAGLVALGDEVVSKS